MPKSPKSPKRLAKLTPEEDKVWTDFFSWYVDSGWTDNKAGRLAWIDLVQVFPRLKDYDGAEAEPMTPEEAEAHNLALGLQETTDREATHGIKPGDTVRLAGTEAEGKVIRVEGDDLVVATGGRTGHWHASKAVKA
jgi:hypothetical protein